MEEVAFYKADPEAQYRAGFEEGALALYQTIEQYLPDDKRRELRAWFSSMEDWRIEARQAVAKGEKPPEKMPPRVVRL